MADRSPISKLVNRFSDSYSVIVAKVLEYTRKAMNSGASPDVAVAVAIEKVGVGKSIRNAILKEVVTALKIGASVKISVDPVAVRAWYMNTAYDPTGVQIQTSLRSTLIKTIKQSQKTGEAWRSAAQRLHDVGVSRSDIANDVKLLLDAAKDSYKLAGDAIGYRRYQAQIKAVQRRIDRLVDPSTSKLKRAYQDVVDAAKSGSEKALENATKYAAYFKERYNAERIARTEISRSYGQSFFSENLSDPDCIGYRSSTSSNHIKVDICDFHAKADLYGMGPGCYPIKKGPPYPYHPHCTCILTPIFSGEAGQFNPKAGKTFLSKISADERRAMLGSSGASDFERSNGRQWQSQLKNWNGQEDHRVTVPPDVLHGK